MATGRTTPVIFGCENASEIFVGEYVVKLRGGIDTRESGLLCELIAAKLAAHFGIASPEPAVVQIDQALAELMAVKEPSHAVSVRNSVGLNFGTRMMTGFSTWPVDRSIPEAMWQAATDVFAFDALIQNPDRRSGNPNLFTNGDSLLIFDHETAFSFLLSLFPSQTPWKLSGQQYLADHVFFGRLKAKVIDLAAFSLSLDGLSDILLGDIFSDVPAEWKTGALPKIESHLKLMRQNASDFMEEVRRFLV
ncbi:MAG: HipA family kinase [Terriglobales bacterium]